MAINIQEFFGASETIVWLACIPDLTIIFYWGPGKLCM